MKYLKSFLKIIFLFYVLICVALYLFQEKLIFFPEKLNSDYQFEFSEKFDEIKVNTRDHNQLNGILFKADSSRGLIFYLHGNAGSVRTWGNVAHRYTELGYDVFILDYPGYGKSSGRIGSQDQLFGEIQDSYDLMKKHTMKIR